jgi:Tfp pilus assembly protein FimT
MILQTGNKQKIRSRLSGFTLIELVLVMAILIVVLSVSGTSLTSFFKGRTLEAEGKRFLALTRYAQNRAISEGFPMQMWVDTTERKYGLEIAAGMVEWDDKAVEFDLGRDIAVESAWPQGAAIRQQRNQFFLRFSPDGFIDETNPELIEIKEKDGEAVYIVPALNRLNYEITTNEVYAVRR